MNIQKILVFITIKTLVSGIIVDEIFYGKYKISKDKETFVNLLPPTRSQHHPKVCHASWAFAITSSMAVHFNIAKNGAFPEVVLSPQMLIHTRPEKVDFSCNDSSKVNIEDILENLKTKGVSDEGCNNYFADDTLRKDKLAECMDCHNNENSSTIPKCDFVPYNAYKLKNYQRLTSTLNDPKLINQDLQNQALTILSMNGPLVCKMSHSSKLFEFRTNKMEIYVEKGDIQEDSSWVSLDFYSKELFFGKRVIGLRTSFSENVGYYGHIFIEIVDGTNPMNIWSSCYSLTIDEKPTPVNYSEKELNEGLFQEDQGVKKVKQLKFEHLKLNQGYRPSFFEGQFNQKMISSNTLEKINWQNHEGRNFLTYVKNQHIPVYCGSCWAQAAVACMSDRLNIKRIKAGIIFPKLNFSVQSIINCKKGGSCQGGDGTLVFQKAQTWKIPIETCRPYEAKNPAEFDCNPKSVCSLLTPGKGEIALEDFAGVKVTSWERVRSALIMKEALLSGPIICSFKVTEEFVKYSKISGETEINIWKTTTDFISPNHIISIVGWNVNDKGVEYWIARNSWGKEWGYDGFFYMELGKNHLGIESDCAYAEVEFVDLKDNTDAPQI